MNLWITFDDEMTIVIIGNYVHRYRRKTGIYLEVPEGAVAFSTDVSEFYRLKTGSSLRIPTP